MKAAEQKLRGRSMICQRCGNCCFHLDIYIVNPEAILPDGTLRSARAEAMILKHAKVACPHIAWAGGIAVCNIHHLPCYSGTPCQQLEQPGPQDSLCVLGSYLERCQGGPREKEH